VEEERLKSILASLLFAAGEPVSLARLAAVFDDLPRATVHKALAAMAAEYSAENRGIVIDEVAGGYQMRTPKDHASYVRKLLATRPPRLSRPLMETVAIIAYRQPITRPEIEQLRGVDTGGVLETLLERRLVKIAGRKDAPGRPMVYETTDEFLELFGLKNLEGLPDLSEFREIERAVEQATTGPVEGIETHPEDVVAVDPTLSDEVGSSSAGEQPAESGPHRDPPSSDDDDETSH
jgi:segregation and condensation protein B